MKTIKDAAQDIADQLQKNIGYCSDDKPIVAENSEGGFNVSWEGLSNWPQNDSYTLFEEAGLGDMGIEYKEKLNPYYTVPKGFVVEPENNVTLTVYCD